ncbi:receptor-like protein 44 [Lolium rigidum]|uniref:receptor-like protein 44 n=1 Tax=Lolium rigidum TaxID=89674 RepID=UPI001F5D7B95|nr:receptor-like protein 44 [Lolium rigidum]
MSQPSRHHHHHHPHLPPLAVAVAVAAALSLLPPPSAADPYDEVCLTSLQQSLSLRNWTKSSFAAPCDGFISKLQGVTCNNGRVYKLALPGLSLAGAIPAELSNCTNLQSLDLSSNALSGAIPPELSKLLNLAVLNLSANALSGAIPRELAGCAYLNVIDLHANQLSGPIPDELGLLVRLSAFDVSYNRLSGPVPVLLANRSAGTGAAAAGGTAARFNASSFAGNKDLYGFPLPPQRGHGLSVLTIVGIGLGSGLLSLVLSFSAVCIWLRSTDRTATAPGEEGKISHTMPAY